MNALVLYAAGVGIFLATRKPAAPPQKKKLPVLSDVRRPVTVCNADGFCDTYPMTAAEIAAAKQQGYTVK